MGLFRYEATDKVGKVVRGVMNARDEQHVSQNLTSMGYAVRGVYASGAQAPAATTATSARTSATSSAQGMQAVTLASGVPVSIKSRVPAYQLAMFFRQMVTLVKSGIPLYQSFCDLAPAARNPLLRDAVPEMQQSLQAGRSLSSAMAAYPGIFPAHAIASVWSGELAGKLDIMLEEVAKDFEQEASDTRLGRVGWGLTKINLIVFVVTLPAYNLGGLVAPVLGDSAADAAKASNLMGSFLQGMLHQVLYQCLPVALAIMASWVAWGHAKRLPVVRRLLDGLLLRTPIWGKLHRYRSIGRFLHVMDELYAAGVNPTAAWEAASITPRNSEIAERLRLARGRASTGADVSEVAAISEVLEPEEVALLSAGQKTGQVPDMLAKLCDMYQAKADMQRSAGRILSISLMNAAWIAVIGAAMIIEAKTSIAPIAKFLGM